MAFNEANFAINLNVNNNQGDYHVWNYTTTDTLATVEASPVGSYFNNTAGALMIRALDLIFVTAGDGNRVYFVNTVTYATVPNGGNRVSMTKIASDVDTF